MSRVEIVTKTTIDIDLDTAAAWFSELSDDDQARFFVAVAERAEAWPMGGDSQWYYIGGHLRNCRCSTEGAREMIRSIAKYMETSTHGDDGR